jgi:3-oxoacyl-[acyl-carrier protein] reductase
MLQVGRPGSIIFVASINALGAGAGSAGYCASKAAVLGLMRVMATELGGAQIRVNAVSPGPADTPRSVHRVGEDRMRELREGFDAAPLGRLASPRDIAEAVLFLCSDRSAYVTGHNLVVDGGLTASVHFPCQEHPSRVHATEV